jgi:hypothetical protein
MADQETVFRLYRRAQKFLALPLDEGIDPSDYHCDMSEAERLIAELAVALSAAADALLTARADALREAAWIADRGDPNMSGAILARIQEKNDD